MNLLLPSLPPSPPSNLPVTHSLSLPRSQPLITVIGGFGEIRQRDRKKGKKSKVERQGERLLEVRGPALFHSPSALCFSSPTISHSISLFLNQEACICFGFSIKMQGSFAASKLATFSNKISSF